MSIWEMSDLMEIDPLYADVVADRFQRFTGRPAVLERTGGSPLPQLHCTRKGE